MNSLYTIVLCIAFAFVVLALVISTAYFAYDKKQRELIAKKTAAARKEEKAKDNKADI